jgi:hypothetical protein
MLLTTIQTDTMADFKYWVESIELKPNLLKTKGEERSTMWIKMGSNLSPIELIKNETSVRHKILLPKSGLVQLPTERATKFFSACMKSAFNNPQWDSALISKGWCKYHREHSIFNRDSIIIPVEDSTLSIMSRDEEKEMNNPEFEVKNHYKMKFGDIWKLDCKRLNYSFDGYVVQIFTFKPNWKEYLPNNNMMAI